MEKGVIIYKCSIVCLGLCLCIDLCDGAFHTCKYAILRFCPGSRDRILKQTLFFAVVGGSLTLFSGYVFFVVVIVVDDDFDDYDDDDDDDDDIMTTKEMIMMMKVVVVLVDDDDDEDDEDVDDDVCGDGYCC